MCIRPSFFKPNLKNAKRLEKILTKQGTGLYLLFQKRQNWRLDANPLFIYDHYGKEYILTKIERSGSDYYKERIIDSISMIKLYHYLSYDSYMLMTHILNLFWEGSPNLYLTENVTRFIEKIQKDNPELISHDITDVVIKQLVDNTNDENFIKQQERYVRYIRDKGTRVGRIKEKMGK